MKPTAWALKEWAIAVDALLSGDLVLLIRKGGIREAQPFFEVPSDRALLFPTYEHQKLAALRTPFGAAFEDAGVPQVGDPLSLRGWADITHSLPLPVENSVETVVEKLHPFHIWTDAWLTERLAWKPERPAYALLLRVHRFAEPINLVYQKQYGGCRSWLELKAVENWPTSTPVLSESIYAERVAAIQQAIAPVTA